MADVEALKADIINLKRELAELNGIALATGVLLTQLLQKNCMREMNPQAAATKIVESAREAIEGFSVATSADPVTKQRALDTVKQYEDQIRSVLAI